MDENNNAATPLEEEDEAIMPEGWADGDDFFDEKNWSGESEQQVAPAAEKQDFFADEERQPDDFAQLDSESHEDPSDVKDESATSSPENAVAEGEPEKEETPAIESNPETAPPNKIKFKVTLDHQDAEVEVGENEIPELYQKAYAVDRTRSKLSRYDQEAKELGYDSADAMVEAIKQSKRQSEIDRLVSEGVHPEVAARMVATSQTTTSPEEDREPTPAVAPEAPPRRNFEAEISAYLSVHSELRGKPLPPEVSKACVLGVPFGVAYDDYLEKVSAKTAAKKAQEDADRLRAQLAIEKQNSAAAARAPVTGTSGGGATNTEPDDPFIQGFDSGY